MIKKDNVSSTNSNLTADESDNKILDLKKKLLSLRIKSNNADLKNTTEIKKTKKEIARVFTAKNKKEVK
ncbi:MAG: hypothetical protein Ta2D_09770 [Rickettsiales bacterium]|nr:MAG: hypothetical protein Ta2D_09770 [Rickettsiales bacterium]